MTRPTPKDSSPPRGAAPPPHAPGRTVYLVHFDPISGRHGKTVLNSDDSVALPRVEAARDDALRGVVLAASRAGLVGLLCAARLCGFGADSVVFRLDPVAKKFNREVFARQVAKLLADAIRPSCWGRLTIPADRRLPHWLDKKHGVSVGIDCIPAEGGIHLAFDEPVGSLALPLTQHGDTGDNVYASLLVGAICLKWDMVGPARLPASSPESFLALVKHIHECGPAGKVEAAQKLAELSLPCDEVPLLLNLIENQEAAVQRLLLRAIGNALRDDNQIGIEQARGVTGPDLLGLIGRAEMDVARDAAKLVAELSGKDGRMKANLRQLVECLGAVGSTAQGVPGPVELETDYGDYGGTATPLAFCAGLGSTPIGLNFTYSLDEASDEFRVVLLDEASDEFRVGLPVGASVTVCGTILGGTVRTAGEASLTMSGGTLDGVTFNGELNVSNTVTGKNGLPLNGTLSVADGTLSVADGISGLYLVGIQALGGAGNDRMYGQAGDASVQGNSGLDGLYGDQDADGLFCACEVGPDLIYGDKGNDLLFGSPDDLNSGAGRAALFRELGEASIHAGEWDDGRYALLRSVEVDGSNPAEFLALSRTCMLKKRGQDAAYAAARAAQLDPKCVEAFDLMREAYTLTGQSAEAEYAARRARELRALAGMALEGVAVLSDVRASGGGQVTVVHALTPNAATTFGDTSSGTGADAAFGGSQTLFGTGSVVFPVLEIIGHLVGYCQADTMRAMAVRWVEGSDRLFRRVNEILDKNSELTQTVALEQPQGERQGLQLPDQEDREVEPAGSQAGFVEKLKKRRGRPRQERPLIPWEELITLEKESRGQRLEAAQRVQILLDTLAGTGSPLQEENKRVATKVNALAHSLGLKLLYDDKAVDLYWYRRCFQVREVGSRQTLTSSAGFPRLAVRLDSRSADPNSSSRVGHSQSKPGGQDRGG